MSNCLNTNPFIRPPQSASCGTPVDCYTPHSDEGNCCNPLPLGSDIQSCSPNPMPYTCLTPEQELQWASIHPLLPMARTNPLFTNTFSCLSDVQLGRILNNLSCFANCGCPPDMLLYVAAHFLELPALDGAMRLSMLESGKVTQLGSNHWNLTVWGTVWQQQSRAQILPVFGGF